MKPPGIAGTHRDRPDLFCCSPGKVRRRRRNHRPFLPRTADQGDFHKPHRVLSHRGQYRIEFRPL